MRGISGGYKWGGGHGRRDRIRGGAKLRGDGTGGGGRVEGKGLDREVVHL